MAAKRTKKSTSWMEDGDDAHFSGNPAYEEPKKGAKKKRPAAKVEKKKVSASGSFGSIYQKPKAAGKKTNRKRVAGK
jgi:hypothetical protein